MKVYAVIKSTGGCDYGYVAPNQSEILEMRLYRTLEKACNKIDDIYKYENRRLTEDYYEENSIKWRTKERKVGYGFINKFESIDGSEYEYTTYYVEELEVE